jgi:hypothetical protein
MGKSLWTLRGVGPESEAESVRFYGRSVAKWARKSNTDISGIGGAPVACHPCGKVKRERLDFLADTRPYGPSHSIARKLRAVEQFAKVCGFGEPEKMESEHGYKAQRGTP